MEEKKRGRPSRAQEMEASLIDIDARITQKMVGLENRIKDTSSVIDSNCRTSFEAIKKDNSHAFDQFALMNSEMKHRVIDLENVVITKVTELNDMNLRVIACVQDHTNMLRLIAALCAATMAFSVLLLYQFLIL